MDKGQSECESWMQHRTYVGNKPILDWKNGAAICQVGKYPTEAMAFAGRTKSRTDGQETQSSTLNLAMHLAIKCE